MVKNISEEKIKYNSPNNKSKSLFNKEKIKLKKLLCKEAMIEHVGSTSVPSLGGKNIIDIFIAVPNKLIHESKKVLQKNGYLFDSKWKQRMFFIKKYENGMRFNIHLLPLGDSEFLDAILLRNYLRKNKKAVSDYVKLKKDAIKISKGDGAEYRDYKHPFIVKMINKARKSFQ